MYRFDEAQEVADAAEWEILFGFQHFVTALPGWVRDGDLAGVREEVP